MRRILEISAAIAVTILVAMAFHAWLASHDEQLRMQAAIATQKQLLEAADARERNRTTALDQTLAEIQKLKRDTQTPAQILSELPKYLALPQPITLDNSSAPDRTGAASGVDRGANRKGTAPPIDPAGQESSAASASRGTTRRTASLSNGDDLSIPPSPAVPGNGEDHTVPFSGNAGAEDLLTAANLPTAANQSTTTPPGSFAQIPTADLKPLYDYVQDCRACQAQLATAKQNRTDDAAKLAAMTRERDAALTAAKGGPFLRRFRRNLEWFAAGAAAGAAALCATGHCR
jgi:hypothetical protein